MGCVEQNAELGGSALIKGGQACQPEGSADLKAGSRAMGILPACPHQDAVEEGLQNGDLRDHI